MWTIFNLFSTLWGSFKSALEIPPTEIVVSPLQKKLNQGVQTDKHSTAAAQVKQKGLCPLSYSQRERNRCYKDKSKKNQLDMKETKREWFNHRHWL